MDSGQSQVCLVVAVASRLVWLEDVSQLQFNQALINE